MADEEISQTERTLRLLRNEWRAELVNELDGLSGEWGSLSGLLYAAANPLAAHASSATDQRCADALRRVAAALPKVPS